MISRHEAIRTKLDRACQALGQLEDQLGNVAESLTLATIIEEVQTEVNAVLDRENPDITESEQIHLETQADYRE